MGGGWSSLWRGVDRLSRVGRISAVTKGSAVGSDTDVELVALKVIIRCSSVGISISSSILFVALAVSIPASLVS